MQPWIYACMSILYVYLYVRICTHVYVCVYLYACLFVWCMHVSVVRWICMTCKYAMGELGCLFQGSIQGSIGIPREKQPCLTCLIRRLSDAPIYCPEAIRFFNRNLTFQGPKYCQYQLERIEGTRRYIVCKKMWFWWRHRKGLFFAR